MNRFEAEQLLRDSTGGQLPSLGDTIVFDEQGWRFATIGGEGSGLPSGGAAGQFLIKNSGIDFDATWATFEIPDEITPTEHALDGDRHSGTLSGNRVQDGQIGSIVPIVSLVASSFVIGQTVSASADPEWEGASVQLDGLNGRIGFALGGGAMDTFLTRTDVGQIGGGSGTLILANRLEGYQASEFFALENSTGSMNRPLVIDGGHSLERERAGDNVDFELWHALNTSGRANIKIATGGTLINSQGVNTNVLQIWQQDESNAGALFIGMLASGTGPLIDARTTSDPGGGTFTTKFRVGIDGKVQLGSTGSYWIGSTELIGSDLVLRNVTLDPAIVVDADTLSGLASSAFANKDSASTQLFTGSVSVPSLTMRAALVGSNAFTGLVAGVNAWKILGNGTVRWYAADGTTVDVQLGHSVGSSTLTLTGSLNITSALQLAGSDVLIGAAGTGPGGVGRALYLA